MSRALCARRLCRERSSRFSKVVDRASDRPHVRQRPRPSERVDNTPRPAPLRTVASSLARRRGGIVVVATARRTLRTRRRRARSVRTRDRAGSATRVRFIEGARGSSSSLGIKDRRGVVASRRSRTRPRGRHVDGGNAVSDGGGRRHRCARASPRADRATERSIARADRSLRDDDDVDVLASHSRRRRAPILHPARPRLAAAAAPLFFPSRARR